MDFFDGIGVFGTGGHEQVPLPYPMDFALLRKS